MFQRVLALEPRLRHETPGVGHAVRWWGGGNARAITSSDRSWAGPGPGQIELDRDPTASERALGPAARSSAVQNLGPLSIKFGLLTARLFIKP
jgi:hypothetical protein